MGFLICHVGITFSQTMSNGFLVCDVGIAFSPVTFA